MDEQWHVFYRTVGMREMSTPGWRRADFMAETGIDAINELLRSKKNVLNARVYPGASALVAAIEWSPEIQVRHDPHSTSSEAASARPRYELPRKGYPDPRPADPPDSPPGRSQG